MYTTVCTVLLTTIVNKKVLQLEIRVFSVHTVWSSLDPKKTIFAQFPQARVGIDLPAKT